MTHLLCPIAPQEPQQQALTPLAGGGSSNNSNGTYPPVAAGQFDDNDHTDDPLLDAQSQFILHAILTFTTTLYSRRIEGIEGKESRNA